MSNPGNPSYRCHPGYVHIIHYGDFKQIAHDVQFTLDDGGGASLRGPDPY